jgi:hypothetical protein
VPPLCLTPEAHRLLGSRGAVDPSLGDWSELLRSVAQFPRKGNSISKLSSVPSRSRSQVTLRRTGSCRLRFLARCQFTRSLWGVQAELSGECPHMVKLATSSCNSASDMSRCNCSRVNWRSIRTSPPKLRLTPASHLGSFCVCYSVETHMKTTLKPTPMTKLQLASLGWVWCVCSKTMVNPLTGERQFSAG